MPYCEPFLTIRCFAPKTNGGVSPHSSAHPPALSALMGRCALRAVPRRFCCDGMVMVGSFLWLKARAHMVGASGGDI